MYRELERCEEPLSRSLPKLVPIHDVAGRLCDLILVHDSDASDGIHGVGAR